MNVKNCNIIPVKGVNTSYKLETKNIVYAIYRSCTMLKDYPENSKVSFDFGDSQIVLIKKKFGYCFTIIHNNFFKHICSKQFNAVQLAKQIKELV